MQRRTVIKLSTTLPFIAGFGLGTRRVQSAEPASTTAAITIATTVIKEIAGSMSGDGGLAATLRTINGKLDIAIGQLASIQKSIAFIIDRVARIKEDLADALSQESVYRTRLAIQTQVARMQELADKAKREGKALEGRERTDAWTDWKAKYLEFDQRWAELRIAKEASTMEASFVCSACLGLITGAWAYGVLDDKELANRLDALLTWLTKMGNAADAMSVMSALRGAEQSEQILIRNAAMTDSDYGKLSLGDQNNVIRSEIAARLYATGNTAFCLESSFDVQYWGSMSPSGWKSVGIYRAVLPIRMNLPLTPDANGTTLFGTTIAEERGGALYAPDGSSVFPAYGLEGIDLERCEKERISPLQFGAATREAMELEGAARKRPTVRIDHVTRNSRRWQYISNRDRKAFSAAIEVLQLVNFERLKQTLAKSCLEHIERTQQEAETFRRLLP